MLSNRERVLLAVLAILVGTATAYVYTGRPSADLIPGTPAGALDENFGETPGRLTTDFNHVDNKAVAVVVQPDGKFIVVGETDAVSSLPDSTDFALVRYLADGSLDTEFGNAAVETIDPYDRTGRTTTTFGESEDVPTAVVLQEDGKIIVGGRTSDMFDDNANSDFALVRYTADGALDVTFGEDGRVVTSFGNPASVIRLAIDSQGRIVAAGGVGEDFWQGDFALARYLADGSLDTEFGDGTSQATGTVRVGYGTNFEELRGLALDSDGNIYAAGASWDQNGDTGADLLIRKFSASGSYFAGFGSLGRITYHLGIDDALHNLVIQEVDGTQKLLAVGITDGNFLLARFELDGTFDTSFGMFEDDGRDNQLGYVTSDFGEYESAQDVGILSDGSLIAAGGYYSGVNEDTGTLEYDLIVAKYTADGDLEDYGATMFGDAGRMTHEKIFTSDVQGLAVAADDKVLLVGSAYIHDNLEDFATVRIWGNDSLTGQTVGATPHRASVIADESTPISGSGFQTTLTPTLALQLDSDPVPENFDNVLLYRYDKDYVTNGSACFTGDFSQLVSIDSTYDAAARILYIVPAEDLADGYCYNLLVTDVGFPDRSIEFFSADFFVKLTNEAADQYYATQTSPSTASTPSTQASTSPSASATTTTSTTSPTTTTSSTTPTSSAKSSSPLSTSVTPLPTISGSTVANQTTPATTATATTSIAKPVTTASSTTTPSTAAASTSASSGGSSITSPAASATPSIATTPSATATQSALPAPTTTPTPTQTAASGQSISLTYAVADGHTYLPTETIEIPVFSVDDRLELAGATQPSQPNTAITVYVLSTEQKYTTTTDSQGKWSLSVPTEDLAVGNHHVDIETKTNTRHTVLNFAVVPVTASTTGAVAPTEGADEGSDTNRTLLLLGGILALLVIFLVVFRTLHSREMIHPQK